MFSYVILELVTTSYREIKYFIQYYFLNFVPKINYVH